MMMPNERRLLWHGSETDKKGPPLNNPGDRGLGFSSDGVLDVNLNNGKYIRKDNLDNNIKKKL